MKKHFSTIILILMFLIGLFVLLYPTISNYINQKGAAEALAKYDKIVEQLDEETIKQMYSEAVEYNEKIYSKPIEFKSGKPKDGHYQNMLDVTDDGMMGYLSISKLGVNLPIYHGTADETLNKAVGHLEGSSLPVGGENTHTILTAHRGLPTAKLFTNLDRMKIGDTFTITVLNKILIYEVDDIKVILPSELNNLEIEKGQDHVTLVTCTPYAVNTHRLLVRGKRVDSVPNKIIVADAMKIDSIIIAPIVGIAMLIVFGLVLYIKNKYIEKQKEKWSETVNDTKK